MYMAPDTYAQICAEYKDIKERASLYLAGKDSNGKNLPMFFSKIFPRCPKKLLWRWASVS